MAIYLKFDGIDGDATHEQHKNWINLQSLQWGVGRAIATPTGASKNREASEPSVSEVVVTKLTDASSAHLLRESVTGKTSKKVEIHLVTTGSPGDTYMTFELTNTLVSSYSLSTGGDRPSESFSLNFTKVEVKYIPYDDKHKAGNPVIANYDLTTTKSG